MIQQFHPDVVQFILDAYRDKKFAADAGRASAMSPSTADPYRAIWNVGVARDPYHALAVSAPSTTLPLEDQNVSAVHNVVDPVFPDDIDKIVIAPHAMVLDETVTVTHQPLVVARVEQVQAADRYCMLDPEDTSRLRSSDTGPWAILGWIDDDEEYAIVDTTRHSRIWRYQLTEDPNPTGTESTGRLVRLDGSFFHSDAQYTVDLYDGLQMFRDQSEDDIGLCMQQGNEFIIIQAPCPE